VAVVIFGHNKKLYEYSSSDINEIIGRFQYVRFPVPHSAQKSHELTRNSTVEHTSTRVHRISRTNPAEATTMMMKMEETMGAETSNEEPPYQTLP
jgi:hypothetical protein